MRSQTHLWPHSPPHAFRLPVRHLKSRGLLEDRSPVAWSDACVHVTAVNFAAGGQTESQFKPHTKAPSLAEMPSSLLIRMQALTKIKKPILSLNLFSDARILLFEQHS